MYYGPSRYKAQLQAKYLERDNEKVWWIVVLTLGGVALGHIIIPSLLWIIAQ